MKSELRFVLSFLSLAGVMTMAMQAIAAERDPAAIVPRPAKLECGEKTFTVLEANTVILYSDDASKPEAEMLAASLRPATGFPFRVRRKSSLPAAKGNSIEFTINFALGGALGKEGYRLNSRLNSLSPPTIAITAATPAGLFYGGQTLRQLLPAAIYAKTKQANVKWTIPCCTIEDKPRFPWRGYLLDDCRHFFGKEFAKRTIDLMAIHKLNTLHWHLTEDQGWRIEIKKYPKLTEIGSWRNETAGDGKRYGGFYTQDDIREVVAYAAKNHVTVVPEIEMPGHALGALTAYPELSCTGGPFKVRTVWGVEPDVYCAGNDAVFPFIYDVLDEVVALFPSKFIHIGGDECPKDRWHKCPKCQARIKAEGLKNEHELQSYFIRKIEEHLASKGRRLIGWDEILEGGLPPKATVMSWRGMNGAMAAATTGHDYVATPTSHCYLDYPYTNISLDKAYTFEPVPATLPEDKQSHCLGVQGNMWSERTPLPKDIDRQTWPRLSALAEVGWSPKELRDVNDFHARLELHSARLKEFGVKVDMTKANPPKAAKPASVNKPAKQGT